VPTVHQFDEPSAIDMGVDLGGSDVRMAQQRLENPEIGAARE